MRTLLNHLLELGVWGAFFATTLYGHVALKLAAGTGAAYDWKRAALAVTSLQGLTALGAWLVSGFLWAVVLTKNSVVAANTIASLRYILVCVAAWLFLHETFKYQYAAGLVLVGAGIWLLAA